MSGPTAPARPTWWTTFRSFDRPSKVLMVNQFTINLGFYMLVPYLAAYLGGTLGLAAWLVGFVLGVRNFSQQGMFLVGGTLADRLGYKKLIVAGCLLRTGGFALLATVESVPGILVAAAATGFAGALFNPAVRAYLAADAGERRVEAFAVFNTFYQAGILLGPLVGAVLVSVDFRVAAWVATGVFAVLTVAQLLALPADPVHDGQRRASVLENWASVMSNRRFLGFSAAMIGSYVLSFQVYLILPMMAQRWSSSPRLASIITSGVFVVTGIVAIAGQMGVTAWAARRFGATRALVVGMVVMGCAFLPLLAPAFGGGTAVLAGALTLTAVGLAIATIMIFPFEMDTIVGLAGDKLVATHYGMYNTIVGVGILVGNISTGALFGWAVGHGVPAVIPVVLAAVGLVTAALLARWRRGETRVGPAEEERESRDGAARSFAR
ncbi:putative major facilitator superfamily transporter [Gordonia araii NBRC 100433]|uniref:Putative major facilitator superfamily transporter n=1 Tax=Gordonia araii NBRC 100433 TaxID=1073574 RepID=G7H6G2_9ACTN|nr:MFS transporter [Gordonia araii]NNG96117.1 MFS transporter [Gordonia araii NBRC 100433]GAB11437.1 putative major facilitator superfamily transporter [Gordonia araii NBRC 100433]